MSRPAAVMKKSYCAHGFPPLLCNACAAQAPCMHGMVGECLLCGLQKSNSWFSNLTVGGTAKSKSTPTPPSAASLKLGINEKYRASILLAAQRTGLDPAGIAAVINAEAGRISDKKKREKLTDEIFHLNHPDRDWDKKPLNAKDPADAPLIKEWKELFASSPWDERSLNDETGAAGLTQFLASTWKSEATRSGTYLNELAKKMGYLGSDSKPVPSKLNDLLELRYDPTASIVAAAEYDKSVFDRINKQTLVDTQEVDQTFFARHPERDFAKQPLSTKKDAALINEWTQIRNTQPGKPLIPKDLTEDQKARYLYLCHHEGETGAIRFLSGTLTDGQAKPLLEANVPEENRRSALVKEHGSVSKAYIQWLWSYIDQHIQPSGFRRSTGA
ncbi:hypothetical protein [Archangium sp.]|uniref:hypothetical protein n=1 Tax=Archangium sp. TaxID=1872627 RepID=UPI00389AC8FE